MGSPRYSLAKYSLPDAGAEIALSFRGNERLNCVAKFGGNLLVGCKFNETVSGNQRLTLAFYQPFNGQGLLNGEIAAEIAVNLGRVAVSDALSGSFNAAADIHPAGELAEALLSNTYLAVDAKTGLSGRESLLQKASIGADIKTSKIFSEILGCSIDVITLSKEIMQLDVTIPAGGTLSIDTNLFTVALNDENMIHLHNGDWVWLDRDLIALHVDSGTGGGLVGKVIYNERYL